MFFTFVKVINQILLIMNRIDFENLVSTLVSEKITFKVLENQQAKKWYDKKYITFDSLGKETIYGVIINDTIYFDFKTGKNEDSFLKTFISQYTSKRKKFGVVNDELVELNKKQLLDTILEKNKDRVYKGLFYTTLYGIGLWDFFCSQKTHDILTKEMSSFLNGKNISFKNEYSDAMWVYRFKFNTPIEKTNELLKEYNSTNFI